MKLTGDLKKKVEAAENRDEAKKAIEDAGMLLDDDELAQVAGGTRQEGEYYCYYCRNTHLLVRVEPWKIKPYRSGKWYNNAVRYECPTRGFFFTLQREDGGTTYYNNIMQPMPDEPRAPRI